MERFDLRHVRQRESCDCVVATAAILANVPYEHAAALSPVVPGVRALKLVETRRFFETLTGISWNRPRYHWFTRLPSVTSECASFVAVIRPSLLTTKYHCIFVEDLIVYDPALHRPFPIDRYELRKWWIGFSMMPNDPGRLLAIQEFYGEKNGTRR
jgi:hypothetical protein